MLHFFLSYAHGERDDKTRVQQFFNDLSTEIRVLTGEDSGTAVGFHDDGTLRPGDDWPRELFDALCRAQTMIALFSPRYFRSEFCGKEWAVFSERIRRWEQRGGERRARLIPIFWVRARVPDFLDHVHHRDPRFGEAYEREDLRELMREKGRDYERFVRVVALTITEITAESPPMPDSDPRSEFRSDLRAVRSAFHPPAEPVQPDVVTDPGPPEPVTVIGPRRDPETPEALLPRPILSLDATEDQERPEPGELLGDIGAAPHNRWGGGHDRL